MVRELHSRSRSAAATEAAGEALGRALEPGALVTLDGELGSGKTCFVRGLARGLDVEDRVSSPTYALGQCTPGACRSRTSTRGWKGASARSSPMGDSRRSPPTGSP